MKATGSVAAIRARTTTRLTVVYTIGARSPLALVGSTTPSGPQGTPPGSAGLRDRDEWRCDVFNEAFDSWAFVPGSRLGQTADPGGVEPVESEDAGRNGRIDSYDS